MTARNPTEWTLRIEGEIGELIPLLAPLPLRDLEIVEPALEDVLFSFQVAYDETIHPSVQELLKIDAKPFDVSAPDPYTVVVKTPRPILNRPSHSIRASLSILS